jgi:hypothetical protein
MTDVTEDKRPVLRVITGNPSDEELAVILAIVASVPAELEAPKGLTSWNDRSRDLLHTPRPSVTAWRASVLPQ